MNKYLYKTILATTVLCVLAAPANSQIYNYNPRYVAPAPGWQMSRDNMILHQLDRESLYWREYNNPQSYIARYSQEAINRGISPRAFRTELNRRLNAYRALINTQRYNIYQTRGVYRAPYAYPRYNYNNYAHRNYAPAIRNVQRKPAFQTELPKRMNNYRKGISPELARQFDASIAYDISGNAFNPDAIKNAHTLYTEAGRPPEKFGEVFKAGMEAKGKEMVRSPYANDETTDDLLALLDSYDADGEFTEQELIKFAKAVMDDEAKFMNKLEEEYQEAVTEKALEELEKDREFFYSASSSELMGYEKAGRRKKTTATAKPSDRYFAQLLVRQSKRSYSGSCACPDDYDSAGRRCGGRSAYSRPGGASPYCYISDVPHTEIARLKREHNTTKSVRMAGRLR